MNKNNKLRINFKALIFISLLLLYFIAGTSAEEDIFTKRGLAIIQSPHSYDVEYAENYLNLYNNFSDVEVEDIIDESEVSTVMKIRNIMDNIRGYLIADGKVIIHLLACDENDNACAFRINGVPTTKVDEGQTFDFTSSHTLRIDSIAFDVCDDGKVFCDIYYESYDVVDISILSTSYCGDDICDPDEDCSSCSADCGCDNGYECQSGECVKAVGCGDGICGTDEDCEEDECCDGEIVNLDTDEDNCGECGNSCAEDEKCIRSKCETYCGNEICDGEETCSTCAEDCGCSNGYECVDDKCKKIELDKCFANSDCDDDKSCTTDICLGSPGKCSYTLKEGCESREGCVPKGTPGLKDKTQPVYCDGTTWIPQKELNENCEFSYECKIKSCINGVCKKIKLAPIINEDQNIFQRVWEWIKSIF